MPSIQFLLIFLLVIMVYSTAAFILQDLPLERFERSGSSSDELFAPHQGQRHTRDNQLFRPGANFWARYRMMSG
uniref:Uncharacterized protein n=1 Tax=Caenorhabditis tropicalis TaxID=1561998 RepID=A0A1I7V195_9PELO